MTEIIFKHVHNLSHKNCTELSAFGITLHIFPHSVLPKKAMEKLEKKWEDTEKYEKLLDREQREQRIEKTKRGRPF